MTRRSWVIAMAGFARAQAPEYVCPMDREVRSAKPGRCPRCGMTLVAGLPAPEEYVLEFRARPPQIPAGVDVTLEFRIRHPRTGQVVQRFETVHEKLFHLFLVSQDLQYFSHEHPVLLRDGWFRLQTRLPRPGTYRLLTDFNPAGGTPQLVARTFSTAGYASPLEAGIAHPAADFATKQCENLRVELRTEPAAPLAGKKTMLFFRVTPAEGLEQYLGAWAHLLAVSGDLIDTMHSHPFLAEGGESMQFNLYFARPGMYRVWLQVQRKGVVNTAAFTIPVAAV
jgi:hypothetical protein